MKHGPPTPDPDDLLQSIAEIEKLIQTLAGDNAKVLRGKLKSFWRVRAMLNRPMSRKARRVARDIGRIALKELIAQLAKLLIETFIRIVPAFSGLKAYDCWYGYSSLTLIGRAHSVGARGASENLAVVSIAA
jgi:hypothetical protein